MDHRKHSWRSTVRRWTHQFVRAAIARLPTAWRFALFRSMVSCDPAPDPRLQLKIADSQEELEACFALLHDAYVGAGFMKPDPSGLRVTIYHALPTTTTLCAKVDGRVVGTLSLIRDGVFGFPMQSAFDLTQVRAMPGQIAEVSALAIHPEFRRTGGWILFPLLKFMYEYCTRYFDTRHLVIAVNPDKIELYESLLFFRRLAAQPVDRYDFANGAPAVGATLDLQAAYAQFERVYAGRGQRRDLFRYFVRTNLPNIRWPSRAYHTTNDPVLTPQLLDHFFNRRTRVFQSLDARRKMLLRSIYDASSYEQVLPSVEAPGGIALRRHPRFSVRCPAGLRLTVTGAAADSPMPLVVTEMSREGFRALSNAALPLEQRGRLDIELGREVRSTIRCRILRVICAGPPSQYAFYVEESDQAWLQCVLALETGHTHADLRVDTKGSGGRTPPDPSAPARPSVRTVHSDPRAVEPLVVA